MTNDTTSDVPRKTCTNCGEVLPATTEFFPRRADSKDGLRGHCVNCVQQKRRLRYAREQEQAKEYSRQWYRDNSEQHFKVHREWVTNNRNKYLKYQREYYQSHKEHNKTGRKKYQRQWRKKNPEKLQAQYRRRRARELGARGSHTADDIQRQYCYQKGKCWWCGCAVGNDFHIDHLVPLSRGGSDAPENLVISCPTCNLSKGNKMPHEWIGRLF